MNVEVASSEAPQRFRRELRAWLESLHVVLHE